ARLQCRDFLLQFPQLLGLRALERDPPGIAVPHGAEDVEIGGDAGAGVSGPTPGDRGDLLEVGLDEIRKLQVLEEDVEELLARQSELELVLAIAAIARLAAAAAPALGRLLHAVADDELLVPGKDALTVTPGRGVAKLRLADSLRRDGNGLAIGRIRDAAVADGAVHHLLDLPSRPAHEALAIAEVLVLRVRTAVDEMGHGASFASLTRPC